jgi:hypothetical protein
MGTNILVKIFCLHLELLYVKWLPGLLSANTLLHSASSPWLVRVRVILWLAVYRQSVRHGPKTLETHDQRFVPKLTLAVIGLMYHGPWRKDGSVVYNCYWPSPGQSFSGPSPAGLMTMFYCLIFETPLTWRDTSLYFYPPAGHGDLIIPPGTGFPFRCLLRLAGLRWRYSIPPPHGVRLGSM